MSIEDRMMQAVRDTELIANTEEVEQNEFTASTVVTLDHRRGYITKLKLSATKEGSGSIRTPGLILYFFREDPEIDVADTDLSAAQEAMSIGEIVIAEADWNALTNSAAATKQVLFGFELDTAAQLWIAAKHTSSDTIVGHASNGEILTLTDLVAEYLP